MVKGCSDKIWYIPKDVYIWHFKANSITRIRQGMYGQDSGYKGYLDNMIWQIKELQKRFINKNYILNEIVSVYCTLYHFHVENMQRYPMNTEISLNWIRGYYELVMKPYEEYITETMLLQTFAQVAAGQNIAAKGIIPTITFQDFDKLVRSKPMIVDPSHEICGATPAGHIPEITSPDWPVEITDYFDQVEGPITVDSDTNKSRYGGMKKALGIELDETDYQPEYTGAKPKEETTKVDPKLDDHWVYLPGPADPGISQSPSDAGQQVVVTSLGSPVDKKIPMDKEMLFTTIYQANGTTPGSNNVTTGCRPSSINSCFTCGACDGKA